MHFLHVYFLIVGFVCVGVWGVQEEVPYLFGIKLPPISTDNITEDEHELLKNWRTNLLAELKNTVIDSTKSFLQSDFYKKHHPKPNNENPINADVRGDFPTNSPNSDKLENNEIPNDAGVITAPNVETIDNIDPNIKPSLDTVTFTKQLQNKHNYYIFIIFSESPMSSKPGNVENLVASSEKPLSEDRFEEITVNPEFGFTRPKPNRPPFAGQTGGNYHPQLIPPGKPWPAQSSFPFIEDKFQELTTIRTTTPSTLFAMGSFPTRPGPNRPPFAGQTGGNFYPQIIPPGKPLPDRPQNVVLGDRFKETTTFSTVENKPLKPSLDDRFKETTTTRRTTTRRTTTVENVPTRPQPNRPPFAGQTGGNFYPQIIPPGKPLPDRPQNVVLGDRFKETTTFSTVENKPLKPSLDDRFKETTTTRRTTTVENVPTRPQPNRPPFAGQTGGNFYPQIIPPGKPLPDRPQNVVLGDRFKETTTFSTVESRPTRPKPIRPQTGGIPSIYPRPELVLKPSLEDRFKETTTTRTTTLENIPNIPQPNRPPFAGQTGGNYYPQLIPPGKPWPARPEDYAEFSVTSKRPFLEDRFKETTTVINSDRPFFAGSSGGNYNYQLIPPGKPWPAKAEDYQGYSVTSNAPSLSDRFKETTTNSNIQQNEPNPDRPSFAGQTGGIYDDQLIPPGKPWPARPDDYESFSATSKKPSLDDRFQETTTHLNSYTTRPNSNRPPFAGQTGGSFNEQLIPPSKPWPAKPEDYESSSATSKKPLIDDRFQETTTLLNSDTTKPNPDRPFFAGQTGGNNNDQVIPPGKPWPGKPEDHESFTATSKKPLLGDRFQETTTHLNSDPTVPNPDRPFFAGETGGNHNDQLIPPGKPWPGKP